MHEFGLLQFIFDRERLFRSVRIGCVDASDLPAEAVRKREQLCDFLPFLFWRLMKRQAQNQLIVSPHGIVHPCCKRATSPYRCIHLHLLLSWEGQNGTYFAPINDQYVIAWPQVTY